MNLEVPCGVVRFHHFGCGRSHAAMQLPTPEVLVAMPVELKPETVHECGIERSAGIVNITHEVGE